MRSVWKLLMTSTNTCVKQNFPTYKQCNKERGIDLWCFFPRLKFWEWNWFFEACLDNFQNSLSYIDICVSFTLPKLTVCKRTVCKETFTCTVSKEKIHGQLWYGDIMVVLSSATFLVIISIRIVLIWYQYPSSNAWRIQ